MQPTHYKGDASNIVLSPVPHPSASQTLGDTNNITCESGIPRITLDINIKIPSDDVIDSNAKILLPTPHLNELKQNDLQEFQKKFSERSESEITKKWPSRAEEYFQAANSKEALEEVSAHLEQVVRDLKYGEVCISNMSLAEQQQWYTQQVRNVEAQLSFAFERKGVLFNEETTLLEKLEYLQHAANVKMLAYIGKFNDESLNKISEELAKAELSQKSTKFKEECNKIWEYLDKKDKLGEITMGKTFYETPISVQIYDLCQEVLKNLEEYKKSLICSSNNEELNKQIKDNLLQSLKAYEVLVQKHQVALQKDKVDVEGALSDIRKEIAVLLPNSLRNLE